MVNSKEKREITPLREATYFILLSLYQKPKHGYAIMKDVESMSEERIRFSTGTLYGAIKRLLRDGWIRRVEELIQKNSNRERKSYALTDLGQKVFNNEYYRLQTLLNLTKKHTALGESRSN